MRIPNVFTAMADIFAGYFVASSAINSIPRPELLIILLSASSSLYISGIIFNDYFDYQTDLKERPFRPLPSGRISKTRALYLATTFMIAGNVLAALSSLQSFVVSIVLSAFILAYDMKSKDTPLGPINMGANRFLNVILGASVIIPGFAWETVASYSLYAIASILLLYVCIITIMSKMEVTGMQGKKTYIIIFGMLFVMCVTVLLKFISVLPDWSIFLNLSIFALVTLPSLKNLLANPSAEQVQRSVKVLVLGIIILDSIFVAGSSGMLMGIAVLSLIVPAMFLSKVVYVT